MHVDLRELSRQKELARGQERNRLYRATINREWLSAVPHRLNVAELSWEEFRDNFCLRYGMMPLDIPANFDGCDKRLLIEHALS